MKGAPDQRNQLARYINIALNYSYKAEQIYIVYLPSTDNDGPDESAEPWINPKTGVSYQDMFVDRFKVLNSDTIKNWIESLKEPSSSLFEKRIIA